MPVVAEIHTIAFALDQHILNSVHQDMEKFESELKALHMALEQVQTTLTSPELARLSLKEQLTQRQVIFLPLTVSST